MKNVSAGLLNVFLTQFRNLNIDLNRILKEFKTDRSVLNNPINKVDMGIFGRYMEEIVRLSGNQHVGFEAGFMIPFMVTTTYFNLYHDCKTVADFFDKLHDMDAVNPITLYKTFTDGEYFHYQIISSESFTKKHPVAARQWNEAQFGIGLQYAYGYSGRFLRPEFAYTIYSEDSNGKLIEEYLDCPVFYEKERMGMTFKKSILDLPIRTANKELLPVFEDMMAEMKRMQNKDLLSSSVRRYLTHSLLTSDLSLKPIAERFNMSERNIQRKLKAEGTSFQQILDSLRMELARKYLRERIPLVEIAFLLGFESQSAFNKFFSKHFNTTPSQFTYAINKPH